MVRHEHGERHAVGAQPRRVTLALAWRPFQANPPTQFLAHPGGVSEIDALLIHKEKEIMQV